MLFEGSAVIYDKAGDVPVVLLIGDTATRTVRVYASSEQQFAAANDKYSIAHTGSGNWQITEGALVVTDGESLPRLARHIAYWFAWQNFKPRVKVQVE